MTMHHPEHAPQHLESENLEPAPESVLLCRQNGDMATMGPSEKMQPPLLTRPHTPQQALRIMEHGCP